VLNEVCRVANVLSLWGVRKGDTVAIYMPMMPDIAFAMLACARIGAVHSVVFGGFSADSLRDRILDARSKWVITADEGRRGGRSIPLKATTDVAVAQCTCVERVFVYQHTHADVPMGVRDVCMTEQLKAARPFCPAVAMDAEDLLFLLYTSGTSRGHVMGRWCSASPPSASNRTQVAQASPRASHTPARGTFCTPC